MSLRYSLTGSFILFALFQMPAQACSDDSCYPTWDLKRDQLDTCNNLSLDHISSLSDRDR